MSISPQTIAHLTEALPGTTARAMFGEYALHLEGRMTVQRTALPPCGRHRDVAQRAEEQPLS